MATQLKFPFSVPRRIELEFRRAMQKLLLVDFPPDATAEQIRDKVLAFTAKTNYLEKIGDFLARRMVTQLRVHNARSWREAARKSSRGREIYLALQEELRGPVGIRVQQIIGENAKLISSVPSKVAESLVTEIANYEQQGLRPETIAKHLRARVPQLTRSRVALIARTETGKAASAITEARSLDIGIPAYLWDTSQDQRVRKSHQLMQDVIVFWNDPPAPEQLAHLDSEGHYHAGNIYNCRCGALPIVSIEALAWPHRMYAAGQIRTVTLAYFRRLFEEQIGKIAA